MWQIHILFIQPFRLENTKVKKFDVSVNREGHEET